MGYKMNRDARYGNAVGRIESGLGFAVGESRLRGEAKAVSALMDRAAVPVLASSQIIAAPARGPVSIVPQTIARMTAQGPVMRRDTRDGFHPVRRVDAFDRIAAAVLAGGGASPFTVAQVDAGRGYAGLVERVASEGLRCGSGEVQGQAGGGKGRDWMDGVIRRSAQLAAMRAAIPVSVALAPPVGEAGQVVRVRDVVDAVCLRDLVLTDVLAEAGLPVRNDSKAALMAALLLGLDALYGTT